jgi:hypothetical protein
LERQARRPVPLKRNQNATKRRLTALSLEAAIELKRAADATPEDLAVLLI